jgi:dTDP-4-amino-4,6-dideoxygalactose transaminase
VVGSKLDFSRRKEAHRMAVGLMDIKGQYAELQGRIEKAVLEVLRSGRVILGPNVKAFEDEASAYMGTTGSVGVANGTDGLTIALRALGVGHGDEVITVPFTFYATAEAIAQAGAKPVFVDILPHTLNMDPAAIKAAITPKTKAIMPVDLFGLPADIDGIKTVAEAHGLPVVEDACQAWGATYHGHRAGSLGDMGVFSFFPTKNLGGYGDGGLVTGHSEVLVQRARELRFHGSKDKKTFTDIGFNSRLDEVQAAILRIELQVIDEWNGRRALVAEWYDEYLPDEIMRPTVPDSVTHVYHLYVLRHPQRDAIAAACRERKVDCAAYYTTPLQLQPVFADQGHKLGDFPCTDEAAAQNLAVPMHPNLTEEQVKEVAAAVAAGLA